jgi:anti-anti-sigma regulatory factor
LLTRGEAGVLRKEKVSEVEMVLIVAGSLFGESAIEFDKEIENLAETSFPIISLDLSMALGITSATIGKVLAVYRRLQSQNRKLRIKGCSDVLLDIFQKIKLDTLIQITK